MQIHVLIITVICQKFAHTLMIPGCFNYILNESHYVYRSTVETGCYVVMRIFFIKRLVL